MKNRSYRAFAYTALASLVALAACTDTAKAPDARALYQVVEIAEAENSPEYLLVPVSSRAMPADEARRAGLRFGELSDLGEYLDGLSVEASVYLVGPERFAGSDEGFVALDVAEAYELADAVSRDIRVFHRGEAIHGGPSSEPFKDDQSDYWGEGDTSLGNCYRYAVGDPMKPGEPHYPFPGGRDPGGHISCEEVMNGARADGAMDTEDDGECPAGYYKICAAIQDESAPDHNDFHWYSQQGGTWSHKRGDGPVETTDGSGDPIEDPESSNREFPGTPAYDKFCGCLCVPLGPLYLDIDAGSGDGDGDEEEDEDEGRDKGK